MRSLLDSARALLRDGTYWTLLVMLPTRNTVSSDETGDTHIGVRE
jgi:hypothetical protein